MRDLNIRQATIGDVPAMLGVWRASDEDAGAERQAELAAGRIGQPIREWERPAVKYARIMHARCATG